MAACEKLSSLGLGSIILGTQKMPPPIFMLRHNVPWHLLPCNLAAFEAGSYSISAFFSSP
jgi:hypothetical protein